jgi:hypothetical protein
MEETQRNWRTDKKYDRIKWSGRKKLCKKNILIFGFEEVKNENYMDTLEKVARFWNEKSELGMTTK